MYHAAKCKKTPEEFSSSTCRKTIWQIYHLAPITSWFSLQILSNSTGTVLELLEFSKCDEEQRQAGEKQLYRLIEDIQTRYHLECYSAISKITCEFRYGFGCDYTIRLYVND